MEIGVSDAQHSALEPVFLFLNDHALLLHLLAELELLEVFFFFQIERICD